LLIKNQLWIFFTRNHLRERGRAKQERVKPPISNTKMYSSAVSQLGGKTAITLVLGVLFLFGEFG